MFRPRPLVLNRQDAGRQLARHPTLKAYASNPSALILALPRGGVPVAYELAKCLHIPMDVLVVRKLGIPGHEETAMGAIATGGAKYLNQDMIRMLRIKDEDVERVTQREMAELDRRTHTYRSNRPFPSLTHKIVILVDDGIATGATLRAGIRAVRNLNPTKIVVAVPVGPPDSVQELKELADEVVCLHMPEPFHAVGLWYETFGQTEDEEVIRLLDQAAAANAGGTKKIPVG
ncbi:phosphoribosyltransferase-like protein [Phlyctochytrium arcticum]|nr:phosphoribosyltransferase-like protein [Phlyctochytrium arcticum]